MLKGDSDPGYTDKVSRVGTRENSQPALSLSETHQPLKCGDHELEVQPMVLQIAPLRLDMLERHAPVELEL